MTRCIPLILTVLALALPAAANAHRHSPDPTRVAYADALRFWHAAPCGGHVQIVRRPVPVSFAEGAEVGSWAEWDGGTENEDLESAPQPFSGCIIGLNPAAWRSARYEATEAWPEYSALIIHEVGHLLGHVHSKDPRNVMYPEAGFQLWLTGETCPGWR